jgi:hypothetical protein
MGGVRSDLAVLGLEPGADRRAIDDAFRNLMKQHHPDRAGGDGARAAEIIRAYRALRPGAMIARDIEFRDRPGRRAAQWRWWGLGLLAVVAAVVLASLADPTPRSGPARLGTEVARELGLRPPKEPGLIEQPLNEAAIDAAADKALAMIGRSDEMKLAEESRDCHLEFRNSRTLAGFDGCVAFDVAVVLLQDRDPLRDQGPFRQVAVNRRHWSDAAMLSSDSLAIDSRLDRIRLRVELRLAPGEPLSEVADEAG